jgi:hypothetical protein
MVVAPSVMPAGPLPACLFTDTTNGVAVDRHGRQTFLPIFSARSLANRKTSAQDLRIKPGTEHLQ